MKRSYRIYDSVVELDEIKRVKSHQSPRKQQPASRSHGLPLQDVEPFESIGLRFAATAAASGGHRVYRDQDNNLLVGTPRLTVQLDPKLSHKAVIAYLNEKHLCIVAQLSFAKNLFDVRLIDGRDPLDVANDLAVDTNCRFAIPEMIQRMERRSAATSLIPAIPSFVPTDPRYSNQWHWPIIEAEQAWGVTRGKDVTIAIIDHGFEVTHPDLQSGIVGGARFKENGPDAPATFMSDLSSIASDNHGTFCAGMAAARSNNGRFGCGIAPECNLVCVSVYENLFGSPQTMARAVAFAGLFLSENPHASPGDGAHVISCSITPAGPPLLRPDMSLALDFIATKCRGKKGVPFFYAVNDMPIPISNDPIASDSRVVSVGMSTRNDRAPDGQGAFGPELQLLAPGKGVMSTEIGRSFGSGEGTSFATPCAAGVAALVLAANPSLSSQQVVKCILDGCDKIGGVPYDAKGHHPRYGFGRVNANKSVTLASAPTPIV